MYHSFNYAADYSHLLQDNEGEKKNSKEENKWQVIFSRPGVHSQQI